jgi:5-formyltetrahydrofolate cyclo-ligase
MKNKKKALRRQLLDRRATMMAEERQASDRAITERFLDLPEYRAAGTVLLYASYGSEVDTFAIARAAINDGKCVAYPLCNESDHTMKFLICRPDELMPGYRGIPEPPEGFGEAETDGASVCVLPGLAFDREGHRIGYGGGYYDRFLEGFQGITVGLARFLMDRLPYEPHDIPCKITVTEKEVIRS